MENETASKSRWSDRLEFIAISVDVLMIFVVLINLALVIFDWFFGFAFFQKIVQGFSYNFFVYYRDVVHPDFLFYDSIFITIFVSELLISWVISILLKTYGRWWLYPIMHWYDVLGCIPLGTFKWLRLLRIISIELRLSKMGKVHLRKTYLYKVFYDAYEIFVQELTDRVMVRVIEALQRVMKSESKEGKKSVLAEAIKTDQAELAKVIAVMVNQVAVDNYKQHGDEMIKQIKEIIQNAFDNSEEMKKIGKIPIVGRKFTQKLEESLSDIASQLADSLQKKLASDEITRLVEGAINTSLNALTEEDIKMKTKTGVDSELHVILKGIVDNALEQVKENIENESKLQRRIREPEENIKKAKG